MLLYADDGETDGPTSGPVGSIYDFDAGDACWC